MKGAKLIALGAVMAAISALFQIIPHLFSEVFAPLTMLSAIPIYLVSRLNPKMGIMTFIIACTLTASISLDEVIFLLFANGPVGLGLGISSYYTDKKIAIWCISAVFLTLTISIVNFMIGIPVFGAKIPGNYFMVQIFLLVFSFFYSIIFHTFCKYIFNKINKIYNIEKWRDEI